MMGPSGTEPVDTNSEGDHVLRETRNAKGVVTMGETKGPTPWVLIFGAALLLLVVASITGWAVWWAASQFL